MASKNVLTLEDASFERDVLKSDVPVLVDFWAPWCAPCRAIAPAVEELAETYAGKVKVGKLNVDDHPNIPQRYGIRGIPTLLLFKGGAAVDQIVGGVPKSKIEDMLKNAL
ncbi:MAG: thioredoxin [Deltaproteobacteria bacterium]|nr:thioredoxin [Deltaproteobacteria bacterium]